MNRLTNLLQPSPPSAFLRGPLRFILVAAALIITTAAGAQEPSFEASVRTEALGSIAVQYEGRVRSMDSHAAHFMQMVSGPHEVGGQARAFTYLDMIFRPARYAAADVIYVKKKPMRAQIVDALSTSARIVRDAGAMPLAPGEMSAEQFNERAASFMDTGLISEQLLLDPAVRPLIEAWSSDVIRTAKFVDMLQTAMGVKDPQVLRENLRIVPPPGGDESQPWLTVDQLSQLLAADVLPAGADAALAADIVQQWRTMENGWRMNDPAAVNGALERLASMLPRVAPEMYPAAERLEWESWYFRAKNLTWVWLLYALALAPLLLYVVFRWNGARYVGLGLFLLAFGFHTFALLLRWYVSGRWPNSNMFEAVTTAAWFGGALAVILEPLLRRSSMRGLIAIGSACASMVALMCAHYMPLSLNATISNTMPVLNDVWLYIHTNVIIFSYCLIFMAAVSATLYLLYRLVAWFQDAPTRWQFARAGGAGGLILEGVRSQGDATDPDRAAAGTRMRAGGAGFGQVLDGVTMVLMELAFVMLWAGLVMGAIWADHSWGRPWGWDPKEVFALNTFLIFLILVHVRLKVRDKGLWTAVLAVIGCGVMLFNWIVINFVITGLHSYA